MKASLVLTILVFALLANQAHAAQTCADLCAGVEKSAANQAQVDSLASEIAKQVGFYSVNSPVGGLSNGYEIASWFIHSDQMNLYKKLPSVCAAVRLGDDPRVLDVARLAYAASVLKNHHAPWECK